MEIRIVLKRSHRQCLNVLVVISLTYGVILLMSGLFHNEPVIQEECDISTIYRAMSFSMIPSVRHWLSMSSSVTLIVYPLVYP